MLYVLIFCLGLIAATLGSIVGLGGGVFIVPVLLYLQQDVPQLAHVTPQIAVGTSILVICFTALGSVWGNVKNKIIDIKSAIFFFTAMAPGTLLGAYLNKLLDEASFKLIFGSIMLIILLFLVQNKRMRPKNIRWHVTQTYVDKLGNEYEYGYHKHLAFAICLVIGILQGMLGIGGGSLLVPAMILLFWFPTHLAIATTMLVILLSAVVGSVGHIMLGNVDWILLAFLAPGALIGGRIGALISSKISNAWLTILLKWVIFLLAIHSIYQGIFGG